MPRIAASRAMPAPVITPPMTARSNRSFANRLMFADRRHRRKPFLTFEQGSGVHDRLRVDRCFHGAHHCGRDIAKLPSHPRFLKAHWGAIAAMDFFTVEVLITSELIRYFVLLLSTSRRAKLRSRAASSKMCL